MKTILMTNKYTGIPLSIVKQEVPDGFEVHFLSEQTQEALLEEAVNADYILAGGRLKITESVLNNAKKLKMIQRSGVGLDALDLNAIREKGIPLYVNQGVNAESVAEHALLLILSGLRRLTEIHTNTRNGMWKKQEQGVKTAELYGKTVGLVGMGNIAQNLVRMLQPFRVRILYTNLFQMDAEYEKANNMQYVTTEELLSNADIVSIHCPLTDETRGLINKKTIGSMKNGAIVVNTARGEIVRAADLAEALKSGKLSYAGIDVHEKEPFSPDYALLNLTNVTLTPHIAGVTSDSFRAMMHDAFRNIAAFEQGDLETIAPYRYI